VKVKELMRTRNLVSVRPDDALTVAGQIMRWAGVRHLPVLRDGEVVGVVTERDLLRRRADRGADEGVDLVADFMTQPPELIAPEDDVAAACAVMVARRIGCLPVVDGGKLVGIITTTDVVGSQISAAAGPRGAGGTVDAAMRRDPASVPVYSPLLEAVAIMVDRDVGHIPVVDEERRVVGILSDRDVRTAIGDPVDALHQELTELEEMKVSGVMTTEVITVRDDARLQEVARVFVEARVGAIPVVDAEARLVGMISYVDVIRALLAPMDGARGAGASGARPEPAPSSP
jgi:CBS domain-containing protein